MVQPRGWTLEDAEAGRLLISGDRHASLVLVELKTDFMERRNIPVLKKIDEGKIDTTFLISHHAPLEQASEMYKHWHDDQDTYTKIVLRTEMATPKQEQKEQQHELA